MNGTDMRAAIQRQRVKYIVSSYRLDGRLDGQLDGQLNGLEADGLAGDEPQTERFHHRLDGLLEAYPAPLVELALVEVLVDNWLHLSSVRGLPFLERTQAILVQWEAEPIASTITPDQFQQITGLDPTPVFGTGDRPSVSLRPSSSGS